MKTLLWSIYDSVSEEFGPLFQASNEGVAIRSMKNLLSRTPQPEDFRLRCMGEFDTLEGVGRFFKEFKEVEFVLSRANEMNKKLVEEKNG